LIKPLIAKKLEEDAFTDARLSTKKFVLVPFVEVLFVVTKFVAVALVALKR
jgi:hypothetical protein